MPLGDTVAPRAASAVDQWLQSLFMLSGAAALSYQVCWQRILFFSFGTDVESITIIVSTFMLGLGLGALAGGVIADRFPTRIILVFAVAESGIGLFGLASPYLIPAVADLFVQSGRGMIAAVNFVLLVFPTALMGATLPLLIAHFQRIYRNVGVSTGQLYFANTLGGAVGAMTVGFVAFRVFTLKEVIAIAACVNFAISAIALFRFRARR